MHELSSGQRGHQERSPSQSRDPPAARQHSAGPPGGPGPLRRAHPTVRCLPWLRVPEATWGPGGRCRVRRGAPGTGWTELSRGRTWRWAEVLGRHEEVGRKGSWAFSCSSEVSVRGGEGTAQAPRPPVSLQERHRLPLLPQRLRWPTPEPPSPWVPGPLPTRPLPPADRPGPASRSWGPLPWLP